MEARVVTEPPEKIFAKLKCLIHYFRIVRNFENFAYFALLQESHLRKFFSEIKLSKLALIIKSVSPKSVEFAPAPLAPNFTSKRVLYTGWMPKRVGKSTFLPKL